ncbi:DUF2149 domain-containing protein [Pseudomaricurvus sp.]|uniref:DUF2149 domain-containing protein n=1 Tax=Pseudomaricurvus sp. TaxID=2004510 RepID=UPI003F6D7030
MSSRWNSDRFGGSDEEPLGPLANLLDLMLVFACGLIAALISMSEQLQDHFQQQLQDPNAKTVVERGKELPTLPGQGAEGGEGYESVGQVYRDPKTGKLILIAP